MSEWIIDQLNSGVKKKDGLYPSILRILEKRGVDRAAIEDFLSDKPRLTHDPFMMPDLKPAVLRILRASEKRELVCVYGDYDADGVTSAALLIEVFRKLFDKDRMPLYYIPSRFTDGYGLNNRAIDKIAAMGVELLITADCGSTSPVEVSYAKSLGMDVIVTDHHTPDPELAPDCLFVNAKRADSRYPFNGLSGCGVVFKLVQGIQRTLAERGDSRFTRSDLNNLLDLVAISTVADVVPLLDENRTMVKYGLDFVNRRRRPGLRALLQALDFEDKTVDPDRIGYMIAPNINALGRMSSAAAAVELFCGCKADGSPGSAPEELAQAMVRCNAERKREQEITDSICRASLEKDSCGELFPVIFAEKAHEGVAGIVAGNLKESLNRPVCIVTPIAGGMLKGTGRSISSINMHDVLAESSELFERFGGHAGACGFSLKADRLEELRSNLQQSIKSRLEADPDLLTEKIYIEKELQAEEKTLDFAHCVERLQPFGEANPRPLFCMLGADVSGIRFMGEGGRHMKFTARCADGIPVDCVLFRRAAEFVALAESGEPLDIAGEISINDYGGTEKLQFIVTDIRES